MAQIGAFFLPTLDALAQKAAVKRQFNLLDTDGAWRTWRETFDIAPERRKSDVRIEHADGATWSLPEFIDTRPRTTAWLAARWGGGALTFVRAWVKWQRADKPFPERTLKSYSRSTRTLGANPAEGPV